MEKILLTLVDQVNKLSTQMEGMQHQMEGMQQQMEGMNHRMDGMQNEIVGLVCKSDKLEAEMRLTNHRILNVETITTDTRERLIQVDKHTQAIKYELNTITDSITARLDKHDRDIYDKPQNN